MEKYRQGAWTCGQVLVSLISLLDFVPTMLEQKSICCSMYSSLSARGWPTGGFHATASGYEYFHWHYRLCRKLSRLLLWTDDFRHTKHSFFQPLGQTFGEARDNTQLTKEKRLIALFSIRSESSCVQRHIDCMWVVAEVGLVPPAILKVQVVHNWPPIVSWRWWYLEIVARQHGCIYGKLCVLVYYLE